LWWVLSIDTFPIITRIIIFMIGFKMVHSGTFWGAFKPPCGDGCAGDGGPFKLGRFTVLG
jgi:hypothetical protein